MKKILILALTMLLLVSCSAKTYSTPEEAAYALLGEYKDDNSSGVVKAILISECLEITYNYFIVSANIDSR